MLSQNQIKHIVSLKARKEREASGHFIAEGHKLVAELVKSSFVVKEVYASAGWIVDHLPLMREKRIAAYETLPREMDRISGLSTPSPVLAVVEIPRVSDPDTAPQYGVSGLTLMLDDIRDPGNMGTIVRIADWFGIAAVVCSESSVELYNPKVVQATMGSIARVPVVYRELKRELELQQGRIPVYGAFLEGESLYAGPLTEPAILLIGNESRGISKELEPFVTRRVFIPAYGTHPMGKAESLNASIATAVICAEFRRQIQNQTGL